jgi:hypothetical protein
MFVTYILKIGFMLQITSLNDISVTNVKLKRFIYNLKKGKQSF